ncbi:MAG: prolipoprotein diacylglyceryl transferase [Tepidisphaeraceae bacterium]
MLQELFRIPGLNIPVYGYGLMMVVAFLAGLELAKFLSRHSGLNPEWFVNAALIALVTGVLGARLSHVIENWEQYTNPGRSFGANLFDAINLTTGGLTFYGGFLVAAVALVGYALWQRIPLRLGMDIIAPCLMIGLGFGRIGCLLNGCCYGAQCNLPAPLSISFPYGSIPYQDQFHQGYVVPDRELVKELPDGRIVLLSPAELAHDHDLDVLADAQRSLPVHPAQIYSTITAWLLAGLLLAYFTLPHVPGRVFALMLMLEGISRFVLELLRTEPPVAHAFDHGLSLSMIIGLCLSALGVVLWFVFSKAPHTPHEAHGFPVHAPA